MKLGLIHKYGANAAGFFWNTGTAVQFLFGLITQSPLQIASSFFNVASPCTYLFFGHRNWGVMLGGTFGIIGTWLAVFPQIVAGETSSIFGVIAVTIFILFGIFSALLARRYGNAKSAVVRETLGHPRRVSGIGCFTLGRLPIIVASLMHDRWQLALVFALWGLGDFAFSFSRPEIK